jgi:hypothetical protein
MSDWQNDRSRLSLLGGKNGWMDQWMERAAQRRKRKNKDFNRNHIESGMSFKK